MKSVALLLNNLSGTYTWCLNALAGSLHSNNIILKQLSYFNYKYMTYVGTLPTEWSSMTQMASIYLYNNNFIGTEMDV